MLDFPIGHQQVSEDELTNWYIRFNRRRLKGEDGKDDTVQALNTLFETLFTLCRTMVSFPPCFLIFRAAKVTDLIGAV